MKRENVISIRNGKCFHWKLTNVTGQKISTTSIRGYFRPNNCLLKDTVDTCFGLSTKTIIKPNVRNIKIYNKYSVMTTPCNM
jgi:hypothetical protein